MTPFDTSKNWIANEQNPNGGVIVATKTHPDHPSHSGHVILKNMPLIRKSIMPKGVALFYRNPASIAVILTQKLITKIIRNLLMFGGFVAHATTRLTTLAANDSA